MSLPCLAVEMAGRAMPRFWAFGAGGHGERVMAIGVLVLRCGLTAFAFGRRWGAIGEISIDLPIAQITVVLHHQLEQTPNFPP